MQLWVTVVTSQISGSNGVTDFHEYIFSSVSVNHFFSVYYYVVGTAVLVLINTQVTVKFEKKNVTPRVDNIEHMKICQKSPRQQSIT